MKAMLLVGGLGLRLMPLTDNIPKPMVMIDDKPFLWYNVEWLKKQGITEMIMLTAYKSEIIEKYFGDGSKYGIDIKYVKSDELLGTAGSIKIAEKYVSGPFIVINGDSIFPIKIKDLVEFHKKKKASISIALVSVKDTTRYGLVETNKDNRIIRYIEKDNSIKNVNTINAGIYIIEPEVLKIIPRGKCSLEKEVFPKVKNIFGKEFKDYFIDIGTHETYAKFKEDMKHNFTLNRW